ncbi:type II toxin-antitoxin system HicB family antitoxin [Salmonella enterica]|uniref:type II toxin-antitoxin system HicB family antitoxin n=1 Tax=Salmonella enterica TaxID=28901 RepID=UPI0031B59B72
MKHLKYKGYLGTVEPDFENNILHGKLAFILGDLVTFEAETLADLERNLNIADLYLQSCVDDGKEPDAPFKGVFNVRLDPELGTEKEVINHRAGLIAPFCCSLALVFSGITMVCCIYK